jgi:hypothetical protein
MSGNNKQSSAMHIRWMKLNRKEKKRRKRGKKKKKLKAKG